MITIDRKLTLIELTEFVKIGVLTINDTRRELGLRDIDGGNVLGVLGEDGFAAIEDVPEDRIQHLVNFGLHSDYAESLVRGGYDY